MGCGSAAGAYHSSHFGQEEGPISLGYVDCNGDEKALWDCKIRGWGPYTSPTKYDSAVVCQGECWGHAVLQGAPSCASPPGALLSRQGSPVWPEGTAPARGGWRCVRAGPGPPSATATWTSRPPRWCAGSWAAARQWPSPLPAILGQQRGRSGTAPLSATAASHSWPAAPGGRPTARPVLAPLLSSAHVSAGAGVRGAGAAPCSLGCPGGALPCHPPSALSAPQPTPVSVWRMAARAAPGGWRWRRRGHGERCVPAPGTCVTPTSCAATWAAAPPPPCPQEAISGRARPRGRCGAMP